MCEINLKDFIKEFSEVMSISGYESVGHELIKDKIIPYFDEYRTDNARNHLYIKKCGKPDAPRLLIDTHFDEIGMIVNEIKDNGFVRVTNIGGIDTRIMQASEVTIYGKKQIYGIIVSTPPHLQKSGDNKKLLPINELLIDTGYSKEELEKFVTLGTPVGFKIKTDELLNNKIVGKGFDNKSCCAIIIYAVSLLKAENLDWDLYVLLSSKEETSALGARTATFAVKPDAAIVVDVNHAFTPDTSKQKTAKMGDGPVISISATTDRNMTKSMIDFAKENEIKLQKMIEITDTGTNNNVIAYGNCGIPSVVVSLPLKNMHTYSEIIDMSDAEELASLISKYIKGGLNSWFNQ